MVQALQLVQVGLTLASVAVSVALLRSYRVGDVYVVHGAPLKRGLSLPPAVEQNVREYNATRRLVRHLHEPGFRVVNQEAVCPQAGRGLRMLFVIISAVRNSYTRTVVRRTWLSNIQRERFSYAFLLGKLPKNNFEAELMEECQTHGDLIISHNIDSYRNLTLKSLNMFEWVAQYCPRVEFVMKVDDDVYVNLRQVEQLLEYTDPRLVGVFGNVWRNIPPARSIDSKYFIAPGVFGHEHYPWFAAGPSYFFQAALASAMARWALPEPYFPLEDVFFTGILAEKHGVARYRIRSYAHTPCSSYRFVIHAGLVPSRMFFFHLMARVRMAQYRPC